MPSKFVRVDDRVLWNPQEHQLEVDTDDYIRADHRVITGIGVRMSPGNLTSLRVAYRLLDSDSGLFGPVRFMAYGTEPGIQPERWVYPAEEVNDDQVIICGVGARANPGNLTTLRIWTRDILEDGSLARPEEHRYGPQPDSITEAIVMVPDPGVLVGVGMRANPGNITHLKVWFGHLRRRDT